MGSKVIFSRAPRGDATQAPPPIGSASLLGTSDRAAREDHTHEGVHSLRAGSGIKLSPDTGLGDVQIETLYWRTPVQSEQDLPATGNEPGDARVVIDEAAIYVWAGTGWTKISGGSGGNGGSGPGGAAFDLGARLNNLRAQMRVSRLHVASRFEMYSEFVDDFNDGEGIADGSFGYSVADSKLQVGGDPTWKSVDALNSPSARIFYGMAYDSKRGVVVLFGGVQVGTGVDLGDTWEWDGLNWVQKSPAQAPAPRRNHAMAYDSIRGVTVLYGGVTGSGAVLGDTWEWDGYNWTPRQSSAGNRYGHAMAFDSNRGVVVLFGGYYNQNLNDTWEWNGTTWTKRTPTTNPSGRTGAAMAYDPNRGVVVMFGGAALNETWEWNGSNWQKKTTQTSPPGMNNGAMAYDINRRVVVLFGGNVSGVGNINETWEYDGVNWTLKTPATSPPADSGHKIAYDSRRNVVVLFNRQAQTWEYGIAGSGTVLLAPMALPFVPTRGYATWIGSASGVSLSRDGGDTFTPVNNNGSVDLSLQPSGSLLVAKIELQGGQYLDAIGVGAAP